MSTLVRDAVEQLVQALKTVPGMSSGSVHTDPGATVTAPALVIGPPELDFEVAASSDPTGARFPVWVVVDQSEHAIEQLCGLVPEVVAAIEQYTDGAVQPPAVPFAFPQGTTDLPSYQLIVEVGL